MQELTKKTAKKFTWNHEEFVVKYHCLANEIKVGDYYITMILKGLPNPKVGPFVRSDAC